MHETGCLFRERKQHFMMRMVQVWWEVVVVVCGDGDGGAYVYD